MKYFVTLLCILLIVTGYNCSMTGAGHRKTMYSNSNNWFPKDFNPEEIVLVVPTPTKNYKKKMEALLVDFPVKYVYKDHEENLDDKKKYRYFIKYKYFNTKYVKDGSAYADCYIVDRLLNIEYPPTGYYTYEYNRYSTIYEVFKYIRLNYPKKA